MAKGSLFTTITGKVGQVVGFIVKNSSDKQTQGFRAYQPKVSNPKSVLQSNQRLVLKPLNNIARALKSIIERGFEGVKYGAVSRQKFLSINMTSFEGPYLLKGDERAVPGPIQISQGSLVPVVISNSVLLNATPALVSDLFLGTAAISTAGINNRGALSLALSANNSDIKDGDQITFLYVVRAGDSYVYRTSSLYVDSQATDGELVAFTEGTGTKLVIGDLSIYKGTTSTLNNLAFSLGYNADETLVAGAVIQSRNGDTRFERSNAFLWVTDALRREFMSAEALVAAINSYAASAGEIDWPEEPSGDGTLRRVAYPVDGALLDGATGIDYVTSLGFVREDGLTSVYVYRGNDGATFYQLITTDGQPMTISVEGVTKKAVLNAEGIATYIDSGRFGLWPGSVIGA